MATFDAARLGPRQYTLEISSNVLKLQATLKAFMNLVRKQPAYVKDNKQLLVDFCRIIDHDKSFPLAAMVVPALRRPQSYNTPAKTITNIILIEMKDRRPAAALGDSSNAKR